MQLDLVFFMFAIPAVLFAGISKGGFGSGAAFAATPLLAMILEPGQAVGLMLPLLMVMDVTNLKPYWRKWDWLNARALIIGSVPGTAAGALIYSLADPDFFRLLIGAVALGFVAYQLARRLGLLRVTQKPFRPLSGGFWGFVAGITSFISHNGGPPFQAFVLPQKLPKLAFAGTTTITFAAINLFKLPAYGAVGLMAGFDWKTTTWMAAVAVAGAVVGRRLTVILPDRVYITFIQVTLFLISIYLVGEALVSWLGRAGG